MSILSAAIIAIACCASPSMAQQGGGVVAFPPITPGDCASWKALNILQDAGSACGGSGGTPGGSSGQIQYNNSGAFGGLNNGTAAQTALIGLIGQPPFYAANYGALCNGKTLTDVTTTSASAVVSSTSYTFTAADVGKWVTIFAGTAVTHAGTLVSGANTITALGSQTGMAVNYRITGIGVPNNTFLYDVVPSTTASMTQNATASGSPTLSFYPRINTTIISVSGGSATLNTNMLASFTGTGTMTFGTDDTAALQAADTAATVNGGTIQLPLGTCVITNEVILDNAVSMKGLGPSRSVLKWINSADQTVPMIIGRNSFNNTTCTPAVAYSERDNQVTDLEIDDSAGVQSSFAVQGKGLAISCVVRSVVNNVYAHDCPQTCIATDYGFPTSVTNNTIQNAGRLGTTTTVGGNGIGDAVLGSPLEGYVFANNTIINPRHYGIFNEAESPQTECAPTSVTGNVIWGGGLSGSASSATVNTAGIGVSGGCGEAVTGNAIFGVSDVSAGLWNGINVDAGTVVEGGGFRDTVTGNYVVKASTGVAVNYGGASPSAASSKTVIADNTIVSSVGVGIGLTSPTSGGSFLQSINVTGNNVSLSGSSGLLIAGTAAGGDFNITGNNFYSNGNVAGTTDYRKAGIAFNINTAHLVIANNQIYDDGAATQKYGIAVNTGIALTDALVTGNNLTGNTTNAMNLLGTIAGSFNANRGLTAPTPTGTGTPTLAAGSDDWHWEATTGTTATSLVVTYAYPNAHVAAPFCTITPQTQLLAFAYTISPTAVTVTQTATSGNLIDGLCQ